MPLVIIILKSIYGVENDQKCQKSGIEKSGRFVIFLVRFCLFLTQKWAIRIYRKTGPTKSTVLGPRPPPWEFNEFYRNLPIFIDFGVFNRAGKSVSKIGIYALPPLKSEIYAPFIVRDPIYLYGSTFLVWVLSVFAYLSIEKPIVFLRLVLALALWFRLEFVFFRLKRPRRECPCCPQKGAFKGANTGAGNNSRPNFVTYTIYLITTQLIRQT
jgi:hypothetical protein